MKKRFLSLIVFMAVMATAFAQTTIIPYGSTWKYLDNGTNQGTAWRDSSFADNAWASGPAQLGYGDGDESTIVSFGPSSSNKYTTTYFRKKILIPNVNLYEAFTFSVLRDDGIIIYVNGLEVYRNNMQAGVSNNTRFAASNCSDDGGTIQSRTVFLQGSNFVNGNNTIAVEIHQCDLTSSDLSFDLQLSGLTIFPTQASSLFTFGSSWKYLDNGSNQGTAWRASAFADASWLSGPSHLGYGDNDEATTVGYGPDANNKYITTYFRKTFNITNVALFQSFIFNMYRDDGIVIYVNGNEVYRNNMPTGTILYNTLAPIAAADDGNTIQTTTLSLAASNFVSGSNTIAVEIHQNVATSSDLSWDLELLGTPVVPGGAIISRGPYLQTGTSNSITIRWRTDNPVDTKVTYGLTQATMTSSVVVPGNVTEHTVTLTGLSPYTKYYYTVGSSSAIMQSGTDNYFMTSPLPGTEGKYTFWVSGDCGNNSTNQTNVMNRYNTYMSNDTTNGWLLLGDNAYNGGTDAEFASNFFNIYQGSIMKHATLWPAPGNHDYDNSGARQDDHNIPYYSIFNVPANAEAGGVASGTEAFYSYDYGNIHFLSLDSYGEEGNMRLYDTLGAQVQWIKQDLAATDKEWIVCYWHHPPYTMGSHNSDSEGDLAAMRTNFIRILERNGVDLILCGHSHDYERSKLMKGHYGNEASFNAATHNLSQSSGKYDGTSSSCAYLKDSLHTLDGTIYIVSGSAGQLGGTQSGYPHNALPYANATNGGSLVLEFNGKRLDAKWLCADGVIRDQFTIIKDGSKVYQDTIDLGDTVTLQAAWNGQYVWPHSGETSSAVNVTPATTTTYYVTDQYQCIADSFKINVNIPTIDASANTISAVCAGNAFNLPFVTTGRFWPGNIFTAELSDASGSFASPVMIGTLDAIGSGTIPVIIPSITPNGSGYRIRVRASLPAITGTGIVPPFTINNGVPVMNLSDSDPDNTICLGDNVSFTASGSSLYEFFINSTSQGAASSNANFATTALTNGETVTVSGTNACGTNSSSGISFTVIAAPTASMIVSDPNNAICTGDAISFTASGGNLYEFLINGNSQGAPSATNTFSTFSLSNGQNVQVNVSNACFTSDTAVTITVHALPAAPVAADQSACFSASIPSLSASGSSILWYSDAGLTTQVASGNTFATGHTNAGTYTYYATQTDLNGCTSLADPVNLVIHNLPAAPVANDNAACANTSIPALTASGTNITWYSNAALTTQAATGNTFSTGNTSPGTYTYYVIQADANGCRSAADPVSLVIYSVPAAPVTGNVSVCFNSPVPSLNASGTNITWYSNPALTTQVATGNTFATGNTASGTYTYYATQTDANGCISASNTSVLTIHTLPNIPAVTNASACLNTAIPSLNATGNNILWYSDAGLTTLVAAGNTFATGNTNAGTYTYYATQTDANGCTSPAQSANLVIYNLPAAPITSNNAACANTTIPSLSASGNNISWYSDAGLTTLAGSGNTFSTGNTAAGIYTYYAAVTDINSCQSAGAPATLTIYAVPSAPVAGSPSVCQFASVPAFNASGSNISWYSDAGLTTQVASGNVFNSGNTAPGTYTYYFTQTDLNACVSPAASATLTILAQPAQPVVSGTVAYCENDLILPLSASGQNIIWYQNPDPSVIIGNGNVFTPSNTVTDTIYLTQSQSSCASAVSSVIITINPLPVLSISGLNSQYQVIDPVVTMSGSPAGGIFSGPGVNGNQFDPAAAGIGGPYTISYTYTDSLTGCTNTTTTEVSVSVATGNITMENGTVITVFPNPASTEMILSLQLDKRSETSVELFDASGKRIQLMAATELEAGKQNLVINRESLGLSTGAYWLRITIGEQSEVVKILFE